MRLNTSERSLSVLLTYERDASGNLTFKKYWIPRRFVDRVELMSLKYSHTVLMASK